MDNNRIIISVVVVFSIGLFLFNSFHLTGLAVNDQKLLVSLDIPPDQQKIKPGSSLLLEMAIRVPGGEIDQTSIVDLEYSIRDLDGNIISSKKESGAIAVKESAVTSLLVPSTTKPGVYAAFVAVTYKGDVYEGSKTFEVSDNLYNLNMIVYFLIALIILLLIFFVTKKIRDKFYY